MKQEIAVSRVDKFVQMIHSGHEIIFLACQDMVADIEANPDAKQDYINAMPMLPKRTWDTFEKIGRGMMDWRLAIGGVKNEKYIGKLAISNQKRILDGDMVELLTTKGDSIWIDPRECMKEQAEQIFDDGEIRTLGEQAAYVESVERAFTTLEKVVRLPDLYRVRGTKALVSRACELTKADLLAMLAEIK